MTASLVPAWYGGSQPSLHAEISIDREGGC